jgi:DNA-binding MarR family transcriptional regulator
MSIEPDVAPATGPSDPVADPTQDPVDPVQELSQELARHARILHMVKTQISSSSPSGLDSGAVHVLIFLVKAGPLRQGALAECAMLDPSTVSRHVAQLVRSGHVERRADPADGRAVQLVATELGRALARRIAAQRDALLRDVLAGWAPDELHDLAVRLRRINDDFEAHRPHRANPPAGSVPARPIDRTTDEER